MQGSGEGGRGEWYPSVQAGGAATPRHQVGVVEAFDLMLRPPQ